MVLIDFSIFPLDKGASVSPYVARVVDIVDRSGVDYQCHAMGTILEGDDLDRLMALVRECFQALTADCERIECYMKLDYRKGKRGRLRGKVASVEEKLGRAVDK